MEHIKKISVEVAYATPQQQKIVTIEVPKGSTIQKAIDCSGIEELFPEIDLSKQKVGIFSQQKNLSDILEDGDRIEIYRKLIIDPKEARKKRAKKKYDMNFKMCK
ncbi:MAG: RnfH family protein [Gammaproteobacteria bacterium]|nr:RnfH family protein [Gammaproteobacteria bacterium]